MIYIYIYVNTNRGLCNATIKDKIYNELRQIELWMNGDEMINKRLLRSRSNGDWWFLEQIFNICTNFLISYFFITCLSNQITLKININLTMLAQIVLNNTGGQTWAKKKIERTTFWNRGSIYMSTQTEVWGIRQQMIKKSNWSRHRAANERGWWSD